MTTLRLAFDALPAWHEQANCRGTDTDEFYPDKGGTTRTAKRICARCPVQAECRQDAIDRREPFGVWGGLSERERRQVRRQRADVGSVAA
ncbi:WhiB family transcriptional regulator [Micromonospora sp. S-DT3-3-22]|uniref:WhiB family transcriptional regulator n=1 Tax=Micromonospora sp. S-DT3-3-22 TaxID=2755359 RepID=UPI00188E131C|nr:WhiB family transcriptional regulator [Micromonospora sp. S-DT3-3-22]